MAVTNNTTLIEDHETAPTYTSIGAGQGAGAETNFYFLGIQSSSRKMSGVTKNGFWFNPGATTDLSTAGTHFKVFINAITQAGFTDFWIRIGNSTTTYEEHAVGIDFYDNAAGGWIPVWVEVDAGTDTSTPDFSVADEFAVICSMGTISGNVKNWCTDQAHSSTRPCLLWDGTTGDLDDFITTETTAGTGTLILLNGLYTCYSNFKVGSATATTFDMVGETIAFPDATWLPSASTWMGIDFDLTNASTDISASGGSIISGNPTGATARKPDIIVTGTSGTLDFTGRSFAGMRTIELTSAVTANNCVISNSGVVDATSAGTVSADLVGTSVLTSSAATNTSALLYDVNSDPDGELDNMVFSKGTNDHHAIEFGTNIPSSITLRGIDFTGFNASTDVNASTFHFKDTVGTITVNLVGCTSDVALTNSYRTDGATIDIIEDPVTTKLIVKDADTGDLLQDARVLAWVTSGVNFPYQASITISASGTTATVTHTAHGLATNDNVLIEGADDENYNGAYQITVTGPNAYTYTTAESGTSPGGTITSTFVFLNGDTDINGEITDSRVVGVSQPINYNVRKSTTSPLYRGSSGSDIVNSATGITITANLISDE